MKKSSRVHLWYCDLLLCAGICMSYRYGYAALRIAIARPNEGHVMGKFAL